MIGYYSLLAELVLKLYDIEFGIDDYAIVGFNNDERVRCKIEYNEEYDDYYFFLNGTTYYLSDFMRCKEVI